MDVIARQVLTIISKSLKLPLEKITLESRIEDLTDDSIQLFELILAFEQEFKTEADYASLIEIETVADVIEYVRKNDGTQL